AEAAKDLEAQLKSGPLPTELELVSIKSSDEPEESEEPVPETSDANEAVSSELDDSEEAASEATENDSE
ncbi:MAG: hypothetical protein AAFQ95_22695, partial [Cyanobacteria bacterium J06621_3]